MCPIEAEREADEALQASRLDWTIRRPGWLTDHPGGAALPSWLRGT